MCLDVFFEVLRTFEGFLAEIALVRLQRHVHADVGGDVVALDGGGAAVAPRALEVEVVCALAANMLIADVLLKMKVSGACTRMQITLDTDIESFSRGSAIAATDPLTYERVDASGG